jgi:hypothetical protein
MQKYRAAAPLDARLRVVIDLDDEIIKLVVALKPIAALRAIQPHRLVVMTAGWIFAPGVFGPDGANRQKGTGPWMTVGTPPQLPRPECAFGGSTIAFALVGPDAASPQRDRYSLSARREPAPARIAGGGTNPDRRKRPVR